MHFRLLFKIAFKDIFAFFIVYRPNQGAIRNDEMRNELLKSPSNLTKAVRTVVRQNRSESGTITRNL